MNKLLSAAGLDESWPRRISSDVLIYLADMMVRRAIGGDDNNIDNNEISQYRSIVKNVSEKPTFLTKTEKPTLTYRRNVKRHICIFHTIHYL